MQLDANGGLYSQQDGDTPQRWLCKRERERKEKIIMLYTTMQ